MMNYTSVVTEEFIAHRDELAASLSRKEWWNKNYDEFLLRADFEMPEWHTPEFRTLKEKFGLDAVHDQWKICDFKHIHKPSGNVSISVWAQEQEFDSFVLWEWVENSKYKNKLPLEEGDEVSWEIIDILPKDSVVKQIVNATQYNYNKHVKLLSFATSI
jgi:hypothetical protein|tara:strand:+ start:18 stop:494 length:477 start_codon:yes stop_codon:yes gene_type:complete